MTCPLTMDTFFDFKNPLWWIFQFDKITSLKLNKRSMFIFYLCIFLVIIDVIFIIKGAITESEDFSGLLLIGIHILLMFTSIVKYVLIFAHRKKIHEVFERLPKTFPENIADKVILKRFRWLLRIIKVYFLLILRISWYNLPYGKY